MSPDTASTDTASPDTASTQTDDLARSLRIPDEAVRLVELADAAGLPLRVTGSVAVFLLCREHAGLLTEMGRRPYHDIDFWALDRDRRRIVEFLGAQGYEVDRESLSLREWGIKRLIFAHPDTAIKIDVFMDELVMAHTIPFADRLAAAPPCITPADLLLSKLQIHEITANDLIDLTVLLLGHEPGEEGPGRIGVRRVAGQLGQDWGFWYEATQNLAAVAEALDGYRPLSAPDRETVRGRIATLVGHLEAEPKSWKWRRRARTGTRKPWYEQVSDV
jgi:hypothetical protein